MRVHQVSLAISTSISTTKTNTSLNAQKTHEKAEDDQSSSAFPIPKTYSK